MPMRTMKRFASIAHREWSIRWGTKRLRRGNREQLDGFRLPRRPRNLPFGISAFVRYRNEACTLEAAVRSALPFCDEVLLFDNLSTDASPLLAAELAREFPQVKTFSYPFECFPSTQGHSKLPANSVRSRSFFYNYCLSHARFSHVWKWDADQIVLPHVLARLRPLLQQCDILHGSGYDVYDMDALTLTREPTTHNEPHFFRNDFGYHYFMGEPCEFFSYPLVTGFRRTRIQSLEEPYFLHFKFALRANLGQGWDPDWKENAYFRDLVYARKAEGGHYTGPVPPEIDIIRSNVRQT